MSHFIFIIHCRFSSDCLYTAVADVNAYQEFLPYCSQSTITAWDPISKKPLRATLDVGWGQFYETFESRLTYDEDNTSVIAEAANSTMFKTLYTKWTVKPLPSNPDKCAVNFELKFSFNSGLYNSVSKNFGPTLASIMIKAFTDRAKQLSENPNKSLSSSS